MKVDAAKAMEIRTEQLRSRMEQGGTSTPSVKTDAGAGTGASNPAASVKIDSASIAAAAAAEAQNNELDKKFLDELRQKIATGEYQVDYEKVSRSLLADMIAAQMSRVRGGN